MPLCPNCGTDNHKALNECMYCGQKLSPQYESPLLRSDKYLDETSSSMKEAKKEHINFIFYLVISLIIPFLGFYFYSILRRVYPKQANIILITSIISLIFNISVIDMLRTLINS